MNTLSLDLSEPLPAFPEEEEDYSDSSTTDGDGNKKKPRAELPTPAKKIVAHDVKQVPLDFKERYKRFKAERAKLEQKHQLELQRQQQRAVSSAMSAFSERSTISYASATPLFSWNAVFPAPHVYTAMITRPEENEPIGIELQARKSSVSNVPLEIVKVLPTSPLHGTGVCANQFLLTINGTPVSMLKQAVVLMRKADVLHFITCDHFDLRSCCTKMVVASPSDLEASLEHHPGVSFVSTRGRCLVQVSRVFANGPFKQSTLSQGDIVFAVNSFPVCKPEVADIILKRQKHMKQQVPSLYVMDISDFRKRIVQEIKKQRLDIEGVKIAAFSDGSYELHVKQEIEVSESEMEEEKQEISHGSASFNHHVETVYIKACKVIFDPETQYMKIIAEEIDDNPQDDEDSGEDESMASSAAEEIMQESRHSESMRSSSRSGSNMGTGMGGMQHDDTGSLIKRIHQRQKCLPFVQAFNQEVEKRLAELEEIVCCESWNTPLPEDEQPPMQDEDNDLLRYTVPIIVNQTFNSDSRSLPANSQRSRKSTISRRSLASKGTRSQKSKDTVSQKSKDTVSQKSKDTAKSVEAEIAEALAKEATEEAQSPRSTASPRSAPMWMQKWKQTKEEANKQQSNTEGNASPEAQTDAKEETENAPTAEEGTEKGTENKGTTEDKPSEIQQPEADMDSSPDFSESQGTQEIDFLSGTLKIFDSDQDETASQQRQRMGLSKTPSEDDELSSKLKESLHANEKDGDNNDNNEPSEQGEEGKKPVMERI